MNLYIRPVHESLISLFQEETSCFYTEKIGAVLNSDLALSVNKKDSFTWFNKFKTLRISNETGYNWSNISDNLRRQETMTKNTIRAPAGTVVQVKQLVGYCGQNTIRTEMFTTVLKISDSLKKCLPQESVDLVLRCDASEEKVS